MHEEIADAVEMLRKERAKLRADLAAVRATAADFAARNEALVEALRHLLDRDMRNTCQHENTHRGGVLWEICDDCGAMWADDNGGKPEWEDPPEWGEARAAIKRAEGDGDE